MAPSDDLNAGEPVGAHLTIGTFIYGACALIYLVWLRLAQQFPYLYGDIEIERAVQQAVGWLHPMWAALSWFGGYPGAVVLTGGATLALWAANRGREGWTVLWGSLLSYGVTLASLAIAHQPRPSAQVVHVYEPSAVTGFPAGHAVVFTVVFGYLGFLAWEEGRRRADARWDIALFASGLLMLVLALACIAQGSHWPSQVAAGYYLGGLFLAVQIWTTRAARWRSEPARRRG